MGSMGSLEITALPAPDGTGSPGNEQLAAVGQLAAGLAHELRNPLAAIKLLVQAACEREAGLAGRDLEVLEEEILRLERLLQTFLDFARPPQVQKKPVSLCDVVRYTVELAIRRAKPQNVEIICETIDAAWRIDADADQIRQVLLNLLLNAIEALPCGGGVWVSAQRVRSGQQEELLLRVADDGPGLPSDLGERIFDPFVSTKETGIGLGLSICRQIVHSHGGRIEAANRAEGGAVFTVRLPTPAAHGVEQAASPLSPSESSGRSARG